MGVQSIQIREGNHCVLEDLVFSLESHVNDLISRQKISSSDVFHGIPNIINDGPYPKQCHACRTSFSSRQDYLEQTESVHKSEDEMGQIIEYRACKCGNRLIGLSPCQRDTHEFGLECRAFFDICVERLVCFHHLRRDDAAELTRIIFQGVFEGLQFSRYL